MSKDFDVITDDDLMNIQYNDVDPKHKVLLAPTKSPAAENIKADLEYKKLKRYGQLPPKPPAVNVHKGGIVRDEKGRYVKGSIGPNTGRPKKLKSLEKLIENKTGEECKDLVSKLVGIALYDPDVPEMILNVDTGIMEPKKKRSHYYSSNVQMQALTLLLAYYFGRPKEKVEVDKNVNISIEKKVGIITKLISDNKERLQLVEGGKGE